MIRINLLASPEERTAYRTGRWPAWIAVVVGLVTLLAVLVGPAWWTWKLRAEAAGISRAQAEAEAILRTLSPAVERVRDLEKVRAELVGLLAAVDELHGRRKTALQMLDRLSRVIPDDLWLSEVREESDGVFVRGHAATLATVSEYVAALESTGAFGAPVELVDSQRGDRPGGREIVDFEVRVSLPPAGDPR